MGITYMCHLVSRLLMPESSCTYHYSSPHFNTSNLSIPLQLSTTSVTSVRLFKPLDMPRLCVQRMVQPRGHYQLPTPILYLSTYSETGWQRQLSRPLLLDMSIASMQPPPSRDFLHRHAGVLLLRSGLLYLVRAPPFWTPLLAPSAPSKSFASTSSTSSKPSASRLSRRLWYLGSSYLVCCAVRIMSLSYTTPFITFWIAEPPSYLGGLHETY